MLFQKNLRKILQSDKGRRLGHAVPLKQGIDHIEYKGDIRCQKHEKQCRENKNTKMEKLLTFTMHSHVLSSLF